MYQLYIKQKVFKITDHYQIIDNNGIPRYQVDQDFKLIGNTVHVSKINSTHFFTINKKVISFLPKFTVTFDDGRIIYINAKFSFKKV